MNAPQRTPVSDIISSEFEVVIIGGGINGVSTFRELALNGVSVLLVDKQDFCAGTSAAPSRIIHGGIKYLENGEFRLVAESTLERNRLLKNAGHLVTPLPCTVPFESRFGGLFNSAFKFFRLPIKGFTKRGTLVVRIGMIIYDWLGRKQRVMPKHKFRNANESHKLFSGLSPEVIATGTYYDARVTKPERLCLELVTDTLSDVADNNHTVAALNYTTLLESDAGNLRLKNEIDGQTFSISAKIVVNAAGPWIDKVNANFGINKRYIGGSKGSHLILDHPELLRSLAGHMLYFETGDSRLCLAYAVGERVLIGATDIRFDDPDNVQTDSDEIDYLFAAMSELIPGITITRDQIVYQYAGVRPLPFDDGVDVGSVSRDHSIEVDEETPDRPFIVASLVGGKWTTFRAFGEVASDFVMTRLGVERNVNTHELAIGGARDYLPDKPGRKISADIAQQYGLSEDLVTRLRERYGHQPDLFTTVASTIESRSNLSSLPDYCCGEFQYICGNELVYHLDDILFRRSTIALEGYATDEVINEIAGIAANVLDWDNQKKQLEIERCRQEVQQHSVKS